MAKRKRTNNDL